MAGEEAGWLGRGGCPVWNKHECSLSPLRHHTSLPSFTALPEKREREKSRTLGWGADGARVEQNEEEEEEKAEGGLCLRR